MSRLTPYTEAIRALAPDHDPRHIEAYMRIAHSTLDGLSRAQFKNEVAVGVACIKVGGIAAAESCARSFGL